MVNKSSILNKFVFLIFLLLYPVDFLNYYLTLVGLKNIPFGILGYILSSYLILNFVYDLIINKKSTQYFLYYLFFIIFILLMFISVTFSSYSDFTDYYRIYVYFIYFIVGYYSYIMISQKFYDKYFILISFLLFIFVFLFYNIFDVLKLSHGEFNYLRVSGELVIILIICHSILKNKFWQITFFSFGIISLFYINSRASLAGYLISFFIVVFFKYEKKFILKFITSIILILLGVYYLFIDKIQSFNNRFIMLLFNKEKDTSFLERENYYHLGLKRIENYFIEGDYKGQLAYGEFGAYIHNGLSFISQFGILNFLLLILLFIIGIVNLIANWEKKKENFFLISLYFYVLVMLSTAKAFNFNETYLLLGAILAFLGRRKFNENTLFNR